MQFARQNSIALTWTAHDCHAMRLQMTSPRKVAIQSHWHGEVGKDGASLAELLIAALKALNADETIYIIGGGTGSGWSMTDVTMPSLSSEELRNALQFELRKQTPLPIESLRWGYRIISRTGSGKSGLLHIRLYYVRLEHWNNWLKALSGLHHLDALLPAPIALDPLMAEQILTMPANTNSAECFAYAPNPDGTRTITALAAPAQLDFDKAFPLPTGIDFDFGNFQTLPNNEKNAYIPALLLALYGLTPQVSSDAEGGFVLPERLHAHRNVGLKLTALVLGIYLLGLIVFSLAGSMQLKASRIRRVDNEIGKLRKELKLLNVASSPKDAERIKTLMTELQANTSDTPDFCMALLELTKIIQAPAWIPQNLEWRDGKLSFQIQSPDRDAELVERLEESPYLGDVGERLSSFNQSTNTYSRRFELTARYDTPAEKDALRISREKSRRRQRAAEQSNNADNPENEDRSHVSPNDAAAPHSDSNIQPPATNSTTQEEAEK